MNPRIRELMTKCNYVVDGTCDTSCEEQFAELIVQECVAICEDTEGDPSADSRWGRRCCALEIREHFGVEE